MKKFFSFVMMMTLMVGVATAALAQYDIKTMTADVQSALEGRKVRFNELKAAKAQGVVGENNRGYVEILSGVTDVKALVKDENADRKVIYQAIIEQNELGAGALATVEGVFAGVQRDKAAPGEKIQDAAGGWVTK